MLNVSCLVEMTSGRNSGEENYVLKLSSKLILHLMVRSDSKNKKVCSCYVRMVVVVLPYLPILLIVLLLSYVQTIYFHELFRRTVAAACQIK